MTDPNGALISVDKRPAHQRPGNVTCEHPDKVTWLDEIQTSMWINTIISRVSNQNGVSQARYIVEIYHSGWKPLIL